MTNTRNCTADSSFLNANTQVLWAFFFFKFIPLCFFQPEEWQLHTRWQVQSPVLCQSWVKTADKSLPGLISSFSFLPPRHTLTSFAVLSSKSKWAFTAEGAPQVHTGSSVQTRVVVAEMTFGRTSYEGKKVRGWFLLLIYPTSLFHQSSKVRG